MSKRQIENGPQVHERRKNKCESAYADESRHFISSVGQSQSMY